MEEISVGIITDGKEPQKLAETMNSILEQDAAGMPVNDMAIAGNVPEAFANAPFITAIMMVDEAERGQLGAMRNALVDYLPGPYLLLLDDDMILQEGFWDGFEYWLNLRQVHGFDVVGCKIENLDGTRYWDWAISTGGKSYLLDYGEVHEDVYLTGGFCFGRREVIDEIRWDDDRGFQKHEDVDFSRRLQKAGYRIDFNPYSRVVHNADYTQIGQSVVRKKYGVSPAGTREKKRILWFSVAPWNQTGYGIQSLQYIRALQENGYDVRVVPFGTQLHGAPNVEWEGIQILSPGYFDDPGISALEFYTEAWDPDAVVSLVDVWPLPKDFGLRIQTAGSKWYPIVPIDHYPLSPLIEERLHFAEKPIAMSAFGHAQMAAAGFDEALYLPHAFDEDVFHPDVEPEMPTDKFLIGMVAANVGTWDRKGFQFAVQAFADLTRTYPGELEFYMHTNPHQRADRVRLKELMDLYNVDVQFPHPWELYQGVSGQTMAGIFKSFDVLLMPSLGEGFGIPIIEAQAVGTHTIVNNASAMPELVYNREDNVVESDRDLYTQLGAFQSTPDIHSLYRKLAQAIEAKEASKTGDNQWEQFRDAALNNAAPYKLSNVVDSHLLPIAEEITS